MAPSLVRLADRGREGHDENVVAETIADVQGPIAPIFHTRRRDERPDNALRVVTRIRQIVQIDAALIDQCSPIAGAVEIKSSHVLPPPGSAAPCTDSNEDVSEKFR